MSLHREHYVTQPDLHRTVFFPHHHTWKRLSRGTRSCLAACRKSDTGEKKTTVSVCQQGSKKELQHLQANRWMALDLKMQLLLVSWSRLSALHTSHNTEHYETAYTASPERTSSEAKLYTLLLVSLVLRGWVVESLVQMCRQAGGKQLHTHIV